MTVLVPAIPDAIASAALASDDQVANNLCVNGDFEANAQSWQPNASAVLTRDTTRAKYGEYSLKVVSVSSNDGPYYQYAVVSPSTSYITSAWIYSIAGGAALKLQTQEYSGGGVYRGVGKTISVPIVAGWQRVSMATTSKSNTGKIEVDLYMSGTFWVDGVQVVLSSQAAVAAAVATGSMAPAAGAAGSMAPA